MAFDEGLAERLRGQLGTHPGVTEKHMFGGLSFLLAGNMCCGVIGAELVVRVGPDGTDDALAQPGARLFDFGGRPMAGWVMVAPGALESPQALTAWVDRGLAYVRTLPPK
ncbi:MAG TPA: TfoX/Sxy family protein [Actinomycetes bacterium]|nr:TfoX/Sxy family protein [Actinomycetes bacterium]